MSPSGLPRAVVNVAAPLPIFAFSIMVGGGDDPHCVKLRLHSQNDTKTSFKYGRWGKTTSESLLLPLHSASHQQIWAAENALLVAFVCMKHQTLTNSYLMVCERAISFFCHYYSADIVRGNKLKDE